MNANILLLPVIIPLFAGILILLIRRMKEIISLLATGSILIIAIALFKQQLTYSLPWLGFGIDFNLRLYPFSAFILLSITALSFLVMLYSCSFMRGKNYINQFYAYFLITIGMACGAVLADNLVLLLFFWEGLLITLFGFIAIGGKEAFKTATKMFIIVGVSDLCMMIGIGIVWYLTGTMTISTLNVPLNALGCTAFILMMIGAISKGGSMPFHTWIPDAAIDAPLPFMAILPGCLEKLLGIYLLARITMDMFKIPAGSWMSILLMIIGAITIVLAVMMALIQKDYKKLLSYHAISQVGYMILGIGTCLPAGIIGGLFHMINNALYKNCLFLTAGSVEKQTGTTNLNKLGGLWSKMPVTAVCFLITAASISGVPPFNGFFSKEMIYGAALERGTIFYVAALLGSFLTAASFLKLGHAVYFGKRNQENENARESSLPMLVPMIVIAGLCVFFGLYNKFAVSYFLAPVLQGQEFAEHTSTLLIALTAIVLVVAILHHIIGAIVNGGGVKAADHIHHAPVLSGIYDRAEKRFFDPYEWGLKIVSIASNILFFLDRAVDWIYDGLTVTLAYGVSGIIKRLNTGNYSLYIIWSLLGGLIILILMFKGFGS
ncbi:MAG: NADH-quinone oxidoreductase subunit L [Sedimentisphaerales bacterium]|jgi:NADH-quinone oxidoreductase subunit L